MARTVIPTNFQDDELAEEMQGRRRYRQILNADGTVSFEDETDYDTEGSTFGASRVNEMAQNINESADVNKIIDDLEDISVVTQNGFIAGAKAVKTLNNNLTANSVPFRFGYDFVKGKYGYILNQGGADTVIPFKSGIESSTVIEDYNKGNNTNLAKTYVANEDEIVLALVAFSTVNSYAHPSISTNGTSIYYKNWTYPGAGNNYGRYAVMIANLERGQTISVSGTSADTGGFCNRLFVKLQ